MLKKSGGEDMDNFVITIGRYCGSGGSLVAAELGKKLGIEVYDRKILSLASSNSGINEQAFELADEDLKNSLLFRVSRSAFDGEPIMPEGASNTANKNLYNWLNPNYPEDVAFFKDGYCWLYSVAHEDICDIYCTDEAEYDTLKEIGIEFYENKFEPTAKGQLYFEQY